jgi:hypothetical protein
MKGIDMRSQIEPSSWESNLSEFGKRNNLRPTRVEVIKPTNLESDYWLEDGLLFAGIGFETNADRGPSVEIMLQGGTGANRNHMTHTVAGVKRVELDATEDNDEALEIEDGEGVVTIVRFESNTLA